MKKDLKRKLSLILAVFMLIVSFTSCSSNNNGAQTGDSNNPTNGNSSVETPAGEKRTDLNLQMLANPSIIIPCHATQKQEWDISNQVFDFLVEMNKGDYNDLVPALATSWDISDDGLEYVFHLREGIKFHNGNEFDADDVAYTFQMVMDSATTSNKVFMMEGWEIIDKYTIKLNLNQPYSSILGLFSSPAFGIVCKEAVEEFGDLEGAVVGTGAYKLEKWIPGELVVLTANEDYFRGSPQIKTINCKIMPDNNTAFIAFKNGEIDEYLGGNAFDVESVKDNPKIRVQSLPKSGIETLWMNTKVAPLDNIKVRKAINHAIDKDSVNIALYDGLAETNDLMLPKDHPGWTDDIEQFEYNVEKAKELLNEEGFKEGDITLTILYPTTPIGTKFATTIQAMLLEIGINCLTEGVEASAWMQRLVARDFELGYLLYGTTPYNPPNTFNAIYASYGNWNLSGISGPEAEAADALFAEAYKETDINKQIKLYEDAVKIMHDLAYSVGTIVSTSNVMTDSKLQGINYDGINLFSNYFWYNWE